MPKTKPKGFVVNDIVHGVADFISSSISWKIRRHKPKGEISMKENQNSIKKSMRKWIKSKIDREQISWGHIC